MPETTPEKIRIAMMVRPAAGGIRNHVATLLAGLDKERFEVDLIAPPDFTLPAFAPKVTHLPLSIAPNTRILEDWLTARKCRGILRRKSYHLIHAHGLRAAWIAAIATSRVGTPLVFTAHNLLAGASRSAGFAVRFIATQAERILAVSEAVQISLGVVGIEAEKMLVIPNGISLAPFDYYLTHPPDRAQFNIPEKAPLVVAAGRLSPEKGFDVLLDSMHIVRESLPGVRLLLAGSGPEEAALRSHDIIQSGYGVMPGFVEDVGALFAAADVVAVPSYLEGQGIVALEAMAARRPVVATQVGGLPETVAEGETGLLVPPGDAPALADALIALLTDTARSRDMGAAGRKRVEEKYTAEAMTRRIEAVFTEVANRTR